MRLQNDRIIMDVPGTMTEVATLKQALSEAENKAAKERTEREKQEARVGEVQQELQALVKKHETLELDSKTRDSELSASLESTKHAKAEAQKACRISGSGRPLGFEHWGVREDFASYLPAPLRLAKI